MMNNSMGQPYRNANGDLQCDAQGRLGEYVIRQKTDHTWVAIQLFGVIGSIAATALSPEQAFSQAEEHPVSNAHKKLKLALEIEGVETFDLEQALNEALKLIQRRS
jgi:hypothetical protein